MELSLIEHLTVLDFRTLGVPGNISSCDQGSMKAFLWWLRVDEQTVSCGFLLCIVSFSMDPYVFIILLFLIC